MGLLNVAVAGALGRMGRETCAAIVAADDLALAGGFDSAHGGEDLAHLLRLTRSGGRLYSDLRELYQTAKPEVVVDFTVYPVSLEVARSAVECAISPVIGVSGWTPDDQCTFARLCDERGVGAALVPNFALGAVLAMRFAQMAARYFPTVEIIELHHDEKVDKPSGTAKETARRIATAKGRQEVPIHSVRLRGLVAHQQILFGGEGELLTIRHDSLSRQSFMSGVLRAVRGVRAKRGLVIGLDAFLEEESE